MQHIKFYILFSLSFLFGMTGSAQALPWEALNSPVKASLRGISIVDQQTIWVSGSNNTILKSNDGGRSWAKIKAPGEKTSDYRDIQAFDQNTVIAMSVGSGKASKLYKTEDAGKTWSLLYENQYKGAFYNGMAFWNEQKGILYSDAVGGRFLVLLTQDAGNTWQEVGRDTLPLSLKGEHAYAASGTGIAVAKGGHAWFATGGAAARVFKTQDYGKTWSAVKTPVISDSATSGIFSLAFYNAKQGIVVGGDYKRRQDVYENVAISTDGGRQWILAKNFPKGLRSVVLYLSKQFLITIGSHGTDYSNDGGNTWQTISGSGYYAADHFGNTVWAVGADGKIGKLNAGKLIN